MTHTIKGGDQLGVTYTYPYRLYPLGTDVLCPIGQRARNLPHVLSIIREERTHSLGVG